MNENKEVSNTSSDTGSTTTSTTTSTKKDNNHRDLFKTIGAVLLIIVIVAGAFIYGNSKHQSDQTSTTDQTTQDQTQSQSTDESQSDQSQSQTSDNSQSSTSSNSSSSGQSAAPQTGGTAESTPQTGPEMLYLVPAAGMVELGRRYAKSRKSVKQASLR